MTAAALPLPDPPLAGEGFALRPWAPSDAGALAAAWADPEVARWTGVPAHHDEAAASRWIAGDARRRQQGRSLDLVIEREGEVAGEVGLAGFDGRGLAEVGWWVAARHRGQGLASAAVGLLVGWALEELAVVTLVARCDPANPASAAVARRAGFVDAPVVAAARGAAVLWCPGTAPP